MERNKTLDIIIAVVISVVLWIYVINIVNPPADTTIRSVPVVISGEDTLADRGLAVAGKKKYTVDVKINGTRKDLAEITVSDIVATADIAGLSQGNTCINVKVSVPRDISVEEIKDENIDVKVEELVTEPRTIELSKKDAGEGLEITVTGRDSETAYVRGAKSDVAGVSYVHAEIYADTLEIDKIKSVEVKCTPVDSEGNTVDTVSLVTETLICDAGVYHTKIVQLTVPVTGEALYGPDSIETVDAPTAVTIKGSEENLADINVVEAKAIDITGLSEDKEFELTLNLPDGILSSDKNGDLTAGVVISAAAKEAYEKALEELSEENKTSSSAIN